MFVPFAKKTSKNYHVRLSVKKDTGSLINRVFWSIVFSSYLYIEPTYTGFTSQRVNYYWRT